MLAYCNLTASDAVASTLPAGTCFLSGPDAQEGQLAVSIVSSPMGSPLGWIGGAHARPACLEIVRRPPLGRCRLDGQRP